MASDNVKKAIDYTARARARDYFAALGIDDSDAGREVVQGFSKNTIDQLKTWLTEEAPKYVSQPTLYVVDWRTPMEALENRIIANGQQGVEDAKESLIELQKLRGKVNGLNKYKEAWLDAHGDKTRAETRGQAELGADTEAVRQSELKYILRDYFEACRNESFHRRQRGEASVIPQIWRANSVDDDRYFLAGEDLRSVSFPSNSDFTGMDLSGAWLKLIGGMNIKDVIFGEKDGHKTRLAAGSDIRHLKGLESNATFNADYVDGLESAKGYDEWRKKKEPVALQKPDEKRRAPNGHSAPFEKPESRDPSQEYLAREYRKSELNRTIEGGEETRGNNAVSFTNGIPSVQVRPEMQTITPEKSITIDSSQGEDEPHSSLPSGARRSFLERRPGRQFIPTPGKEAAEAILSQILGSPSVAISPIPETGDPLRRQENILLPSAMSERFPAQSPAQIRDEILSSPGERAGNSAFEENAYPAPASPRELADIPVEEIAASLEKRSGKFGQEIVRALLDKPRLINSLLRNKEFLEAAEERIKARAAGGKSTADKAR